MGEQILQLLPRVGGSTEKKPKAKPSSLIICNLASQFPMLKDTKQSQPCGPHVPQGSDMY